jgi:hypothetical protein
MKETQQSNGFLDANGHRPNVSDTANGTTGSCDMNGKVEFIRRRTARRNNNNDKIHLDEATSPQLLDEAPPTPVDGEPMPVEAGDHDVAVTDVPTRSQLLRDPANLCTFAGAILATLAMSCMWQGR